MKYKGIKDECLVMSLSDNGFFDGYLELSEAEKIRCEVIDRAYWDMQKMFEERWEDR